MLAAICLVLFFVNLGAVHLWDVDEAIFASAAKEMHARGEWVVPYFNGTLFTHKPALTYWFMIAGYELFGPTEFAARCWSAVFGIGSVLVTYRLGRLLFTPRAGFTAGLILATSLNFDLIARAATPDSFLVFFSTLALLAFVRGTASRSAPDKSTSLAASTDQCLRTPGATAGLSSSANLVGPANPTDHINSADLANTRGLANTAAKKNTAAQCQNVDRASSGTQKGAPAPSSISPSPALSWSGQTVFEPSWTFWALAYAAMGWGVLTKGPIGVLLPMAVIGQFLLMVRSTPPQPSARTGWRGWLENGLRWAWATFNPRHFLSTLWSMRPLTAIAVVLAVAGPWYVLVGLRTDGEWPAGFFGVHNFGRFFGAMENHRGPIFYYLVAIAAGFFPWSVLFSPSFAALWRHLTQGDPWRASYLLVGCWFAVWVGFFSLAGTKLPSYVLPAYPALALFTAGFVEDWLCDPRVVSRVWNRMIWGTVALAGIGMLVAFPIVAHLYLGNDWLLTFVALIPLAAAPLGFHFGRRAQSPAAFATLAVLGAALSLALFSFGALRVDRFQTSSDFAHQIAAHTPPGQQPTIASFNYFRPSLVFYADHEIAEFSAPDDVPSFFANEHGPAFMFTTDEAYEGLSSSLPEDVVVLDSRPRFLHAGRVLLLSRLGLTTATAKKSVEPTTTK